MENFIVAQMHLKEDIIQQHIHISEVLKQLTSMVESLVT